MKTKTKEDQAYDEYQQKVKSEREAVTNRNKVLLEGIKAGLGAGWSYVPMTDDYELTRAYFNNNTLGISILARIATYGANPKIEFSPNLPYSKKANVSHHGLYFFIASSTTTEPRRIAARIINHSSQFVASFKEARSRIEKAEKSKDAKTELTKKLAAALGCKVRECQINSGEARIDLPDSNGNIFIKEISSNYHGTNAKISVDVSADIAIKICELLRKSR